MADLLATGSSALLAFRRALDVTGNNIANVSTDGYSRQRILLQSQPGQQLGDAFFGSGVQVVAVERLQDRFVMDRMLESLAETSRLSRFSTYADRLDGWLSSTDAGLSQPLQGYFDSLQALAANPSSTAARNNVLTAARTLASRFSSLQSQLDGTYTDINARLSQAANAASDAAARLAGLNEAIVRAQASSGAAPNDLLDQREALLGDLAGLIGITTVTQDDGAVNVFTAGGQALVVGTTSRTLSTVADPYQPQRLELAIDTGAGFARISGQASGGEIGGLLDFRREALDPANASLGRIAASLALSINAQNAEGLDAYGQMGGDLFIEPQPQVLSASANAGGAVLVASHDDPSMLPADDFILRFDGAAWSATSASTGASVAMTGTGTLGDPLRIGGVAVSVGGAAAAGDSFLLRPSAGAAGTLRVATTDPGRIAAARPVTASASLSNSGSLTLTAPEVVDAANAALRNTASIVFTSATTYSIDGGPAQAFTSGAPISANGWQLTLNGTPATGDTFTVRATAAGGSDNGNASALGALSNARLLDGGTSSLNGAYAALVARAGGSAQQAGLQSAAQGAVHAQISAERDSVSGVNLDEEAANLIKFQQAYQAAAQVIATANTVFDTLLAAVRR